MIYFMLIVAILGQGADTMTTYLAIKNGLIEANPIFGIKPNIAVMSLTKSIFIGVTWWASRGDVGVCRLLMGIIGGVGLLMAGWNVAQIRRAR